MENHGGGGVDEGKERCVFRLEAGLVVARLLFVVVVAFKIIASKAILKKLLVRKIRAEQIDGWF